jgi:hypothetical protein
MEKQEIFFSHLVLLMRFGVFYGHSEYYVAIWYIISHFGMLYQEKSGNPVHIADRS